MSTLQQNLEDPSCRGVVLRWCILLHKCLYNIIYEEEQTCMKFNLLHEIQTCFMPINHPNLFSLYL